MSLFVCQECECVENTALSSFWLRNTASRKRPALCSQCDPEIGKWHGRFPRRKYDPARDTVQWKDGEWVKASEQQVGEGQ